MSKAGVKNLKMRLANLEFVAKRLEESAKNLDNIIALLEQKYPVKTK